MIIACLGMKGGSGKTTLAINLACGLAANPKNRVLLLDSDEQASAIRWNEERPENRPKVEMIHMPEADQLKNQFTELSEQFSWIVIDGSPRMDHLSTVTMGITDLVFIPVQPSPLDIWATEQLIDRIQMVLKIRPNFRAAFVLNRYNPTTLIAQSAAEALKTLALPVLNATMGQRVAYGEAITQGLSVLEYSDTRAAAEMTSIMDALEQMKNGKEPFLMNGK